MLVILSALALFLLRACDASPALHSFQGNCSSDGAVTLSPGYFHDVNAVISWLGDGSEQSEEEDAELSKTATRLRLETESAVNTCKLTELLAGQVAVDGLKYVSEFFNDKAYRQMLDTQKQLWQDCTNVIITQHNIDALPQLVSTLKPGCKLTCHELAANVLSGLTIGVCETIGKYPKAEALASTKDEPVLTAMTINTHMAAARSPSNGISNFAKAILATGADIAGLQQLHEKGFLELLEHLGSGWHGVMRNDDMFVDTVLVARNASVQLHAQSCVSEEGILGGAIGCSFELANSGTKGWVWSLRAPSGRYSPSHVCNHPAENSQQIKGDLSVNELRRRENIDTILAKSPQEAGETPILLMGDFNVPSHLDWTNATKSTHCGRVVEWPVSRKLQELGFQDAFRLRYPDPAEIPGNTWAPPQSDDGKDRTPPDRINYVYFKGGDKLRLRDARTYSGGIKKSGKPNWSVWASTYSAVIAKFGVKKTSTKV